MKFEDMINNVILGDCYEVIKDIPDKSIDCIYTDIPYLIKNCNESGGFLFKDKNGTKFDTYKEQLKDIKDGIDLSILDEFCRIMKKINCFIWCSKEQILEIMEFFNKKSNFNILVWCKTNSTPFCSNTWLSDVEYCLYFREKGVKLNDGYKLKSKWYISSTNKSDKDKFNHPTIKPLNLVERHLKHTTKENDIVLDCFCGSGTTCVACKNTNRRYIGIELNPEWHKIAVDRLNNIQANGQQTFFTM